MVPVVTVLWWPQPRHVSRPRLERWGSPSTAVALRGFLAATDKANRSYSENHYQQWRLHNQLPRVKDAGAPTFSRHDHKLGRPSALCMSLGNDQLDVGQKAGAMRLNFVDVGIVLTLQNASTIAEISSRPY